MVETEKQMAINFDLYPELVEQDEFDGNCYLI
jgi:hypothetical protein